VFLAQKKGRVNNHPALKTENQKLLNNPINTGNAPV